ncbi:MAG: hypothetical protein A2309_05630 [Bacteroidetes bacterium RIFOXYB2_FULL_35_7]|nr:MAG: hypothetical protein A2X01_13185 [Bacteroidetes bacterium GWF2_35_48]OFY96645.1 MAG: hypothetical protein A2309_05630 [Bacteroidetes bacterium RIFOXYB2_FULL_35_7]OFZ05668.1 MAG: hypothetical protein A2491_20455 [Bacteroidetes bacterium RIFOXYC12_FULL_35_7]
MIANDIISFINIESKYRIASDKALKIIFHPDEYNLLNNYSQVLLSSLLWTCKESAYKIMMKNGFRRAFAPSLYCVSISASENSIFSGTVSYNNSHVCAYYSGVTDSFINTIAAVSKKSLPFIFHKIFSVNTSEEKDVRICNEISKSLNIPVSNIELKRNYWGIPELIIDGKKSNIEISLSNDASYISLAYLS